MTDRTSLLLSADHVTPEIERAVDRLVDSLGSAQADVAAGWQEFAEACQLTVAGSSSAPIIVGPLRATMLPATSADAMVGFIAPAALSRRSTRANLRLLDPTMALWQANWSPIVVDRPIVDAELGRVELAIGLARPTPTSAIGDGT